MAEISDACEALKSSDLILTRFASDLGSPLASGSHNLKYPSISAITFLGSPCCGGRFSCRTDEAGPILSRVDFSSVYVSWSLGSILSSLRKASRSMKQTLEGGLLFCVLHS